MIHHAVLNANHVHAIRSLHACNRYGRMLLQIAVVLLTLGYRMLDRSLVWLDKPHNDMLLAEAESMVPPLSLRYKSTTP